MELKKPISSPPYDRYENTRLIYIAVIITSNIVCFASFIIAIVFFTYSRDLALFDLNISTFIRLVSIFPYFNKVLSLIVNLIITEYLKGLAYIYATSLR